MKILSRHKYDATNEVKYLSKCQGHENIVKLYDVLQDDLHTYIIMELLTGGELFDRIRKHQLFTEPEASAIMKSLISAIQYMHSQGVVHRDLKPENILFSDATPQAKVKIVDFGFARQKPDTSKSNKATASATSSSTSTSKKPVTNGLLQTPCFTLSYAAPEVLRQALYTTHNGDTSKAIDSAKGSLTQCLIEPGTGYDESCDLWSIGVILYTILCGSVPFSGDCYTTDAAAATEECSSGDEEHDTRPKKKPRPNLRLPNATPANSRVITQEKIIERIRNASTTLEFKEKRWQSVSESAKQLLKGLLNVDPKKRMKLKDLSRHEWIKNGGAVKQTNNSGASSRKPATLVVDLSCETPGASAPETSDASTLDDQGIWLKNQLNMAFDAFHAAERKGLFSIQLKDVFEAPLAQRRHHKRSTSSNASSESNVSTNSICSSLSTSTTSMNTVITTTNASTYSTPTKKCPSSCGKQSEQIVFTFNDSLVNEYLQQQQQLQQSHSQVFNRPITRSITHHNSKLNPTVTNSDNTIGYILF